MNKTSSLTLTLKACKLTTCHTFLDKSKSSRESFFYTYRTIQTNYEVAIMKTIPIQLLHFWEPKRLKFISSTSSFLYKDFNFLLISWILFQFYFIYKVLQKLLFQNVPGDSMGCPDHHLFRNPLSKIIPSS